MLGALWPHLQQAIFPNSPEQKSMMTMPSLKLGVLMLLLLTGMETDLSVGKKAGRAALSVSIAGISVPFLCGVVLGKVMPDRHAAEPDQAPDHLALPRHRPVDFVGQDRRDGDSGK